MIPMGIPSYAHWLSSQLTSLEPTNVELLQASTSRKMGTYVAKGAEFTLILAIC